MNGGRRGEGAPHAFTAEELAWLGAHRTELRRSVTEQRILRWSLGTAFVVGLAAHVGGYVLRAPRGGADRAAGPGGRTALRARLGPLNRGRRGPVRPASPGVEAAPDRAASRRLRGRAARAGPRHGTGSPCARTRPATAARVVSSVKSARTSVANRSDVPQTTQFRASTAC